MHIVLAILSSVAGLIWALVALQRSGFNPDSINPLLWLRRSRWRRQYNTPALYRLDDPMDVAAVLLLGTAKCEGEISSGQKHALRTLFEQEFKLDGNAASDLMLASAHLIRDEIYLVDKLDRILEASSSRFTPEQATALLAMMTRIGTLESALNAEQRKLITATERYFERCFASRQGWRANATRS
ncbi:MAG: TerB family tellurite resistance protein [Pseudomonadota bacterium]